MKERRDCKFSSIFKKKIDKVKGQELLNIYDKMSEIASCKNINHYKNLKGEMKRFKRVHINNSSVILFFGDDGTAYFVDYEHHDKVYSNKKKSLKKYKRLIFERGKL